MSDASRKPLLADLYSQYLQNQDSARFVRQVRQYYGQGTLERLAEHPVREVRRAAILALGFLGDYSANHTMGRALLDEDRSVRMLAENGIRSVWNRAGSETEQQELQIIFRLIGAQHFDAAIQRATALIEKSAWLAEAWNQRAIALFSLGRYAESIRDCHQALELNPYQFGAAAGMGQAYLRLGNHVSSLESFRRALRLNPGLEGVRVQVVRLARLVEGNQPDR